MDVNVRKYLEAIAVTIRNNHGKAPEEIAERIVSAVEFAEQVMATSATPRPAPKLIVPVNGSPRAVTLAATGGPQLELPPTEGAILIGEEPPSAYTGGNDASPKIEYWSVSGSGNKPSLHDALANRMPASMTVEVKGIDKPLTLLRRIESPADHMGFVRLKYALPQQETGTEVVVSVTESLDLPIEWIKAQIVEQAGLIYRPYLKRVESTTRAVAPPSMEDLLRQSPGDQTDNTITDEDRRTGAELGRTREQYMRDNPA